MARSKYSIEVKLQILDLLIIVINKLLLSSLYSSLMRLFYFTIICNR